MTFAFFVAAAGMGLALITAAAAAARPEPRRVPVRTADRHPGQPPR